MRNPEEREKRMWGADRNTPQDGKANMASGSSENPPGRAGRLKSTHSRRLRRAPALADAKASEKGALITSEVCLWCAGGLR